METFENCSTTSIYNYKIKVTGDNKIVQKTYTIVLHYQNLVEEEFKQMLEDNIIVLSNSNFLNPMVIMKKIVKNLLRYA